MEITFVNHSAFILSYKNVKIISDPWMEGTAFNNGWAFLAKTQFKYEDFDQITHIWFSHEHPDHFAPPNLFKIPKEVRAKITVLFQETVDKKVFHFCGKLGFKEVVELKQDEYYTLEDDLKLMCNAYSHGDSYALFKTDEYKILNLNDCIVDSDEKAQELAEHIGEVDILFTQFGYANKVGNKDEVALREEASRHQLNCIKHQHKHLKPSHIIPFASFIYFCHEENKYMNQGMNTVQMAYDYISGLGANCAVMYLNDRWALSAEWDPQPALQQWSKCYDALDTVEFLKAKETTVEELQEQGQKFGEMLKGKFPKHVKQLEAIKTDVYLTDQNAAFQYSVKKGLIPSSKAADSCDIALSTESLFYVFKELWGGNTLFINARFQTPPNGSYKNFRQFEGMAAKLNRGETYEFRTFWSRVKGRIKKLLGRS